MIILDLPKKLTKKDIRYLGKIYKDEGYSYILSDVENKNIDNTLILNGYGFYNYIYEIYNTYLFVIGNQIKKRIINPNKVDFLSKIMKFEYLLNNKSKKIKQINVPSNMFTIIAKEQWLKEDFLGKTQKKIDDIIDKQKPYLKNIDSFFERSMKFICDNVENTTGLFNNGLSKNILMENKIYVLKDVDFDGYVIKFNHSNFK